MVESIVKQFLSSGAGSEILKQIQSHGLDPAQAASAVSATAEGAVAQLGSGHSQLSALIGPVSQFVAQKTGISPAVAQTVANLVLPKLMEKLTAGTGIGGMASQALGGMLGGLLK